MEVKIVKHPTHYPPTGKGTKWTDIALKSIVNGTDTKVSIGDYLADGGGLEGLVKEDAELKIRIYFRYSLKIKDKETGKGKSGWFYCGIYPKESISAIRDKRDEAKNLIKQGIDPRDHKKATDIEAKQAIEKVIREKELFDSTNKTVEDLFNAWLCKLKRKNNNEDVTLVFNKHVIPCIGKLKVRDISEEDIRKVFDNTMKLGIKRTTDELISTIRQMFKWGDGNQPWRGLLANGNPTLGITQKDYFGTHLGIIVEYERQRKRLLNADEIWNLNRIFNVFDDDYEKAEDKVLFRLPLKKEYQYACWICLSTLCRIGELSKAEWTHINGHQKIWFIPKNNTKTKENDHYIYLSDFTFDILKKLRKITGNEIFLFPSSKKKGSSINVTTISHRIRERQIKFAKPSEAVTKRPHGNELVLGDENWFPHDLRRTGATMMQRLKVDRDIINLCQNHVIGTTVDKSYLQHTYQEEQKEAWQKLGNQLYEIINITNPMDLMKYAPLVFRPEIETLSEEDPWA